MPIYEYKCQLCSATVEVRRDIAALDEPQLCVQCGLVMDRNYSAPAIVFRGEGFYKTDNKK